MKFIIVVLLTALLGFAAPLYFTWWSFAVSSFVIALLIHQKPLMAFIATFLGLFLLWGIMAIWIDNANNHLLSGKIALILPLQGSTILLILITALTGGIISGFAGLTGSLIRK
ncbi:MAG: hypothetical protein JST21_16325 [Bacteroidetes bacterium]|nr:hypothetical protein [Bacteroidota bacterium]